MRRRPRLTTRAKRLLGRASERVISDYFEALPGHERTAKWIRVGNIYRTDCTGRYQRDLSNHTVDTLRLSEYIAASCPAHVIDGWSFLGRAIDSTLRRDTYAAVHFGYYAELRAAMALLASQGIGILNRHHPVLEDGGGTARLPKLEFWDAQHGIWKRRYAGTHAVVGPCLHQWATLSRAEKVLNELVQPERIRLSDWLDACGSRVRTRAMAKRWLNSWGLDLSNIDKDHDARNLASYRPSEFRLPASVPLEDILNFVTELWRMFEPADAGRFPVIEQHLIRRALRAGGAANPSRQTLGQLPLSQAKIREWDAFLSSTDEPTTFRRAEEAGKIDEPHCHFQVLSRAALLLYVATSAAGRLLRSAGYSSEDLAFWWDRFGTSRGLWDSPDVFTHPRDFWADIEASLTDCDAWLSTTPPQSRSLSRFRQRQSRALHDLGAWDVVAVWGLVS